MSAAPDRTQALQFAFAAHVRDPQHSPPPADVDARRMAIYSTLFFNNVEGLLAANFPVIRSLYDDADWKRLVQDFYRDHRSHTPLFTEIAREFMRYLEERAEQGVQDPCFLLELAHYEWSELALTLDEHEIADVAHDPSGDLLAGIPVVSPTARALAYRFPVHRISAQFRPVTASEQPVLLLLVRDRHDVVRFLEIDALSALLLERLQTNRERSGNDCLAALLRDIGRADDAELLVSGAATLQRLRDRDAILGTLVA